MILATYQKNIQDIEEKYKTKYDDVKELFDIPKEKKVYWCFSANNIYQVIYDAIRIVPFYAEKFILFETHEYYELRHTPDVSEYIVTEIPNKRFEINTENIIKSMMVYYKELKGAKMPIRPIYNKVIRLYKRYCNNRKWSDVVLKNAIPINMELCDDPISNRTNKAIKFAFEATLLGYIYYIGLMYIKEEPIKPIRINNVPLFRYLYLHSEIVHIRESHINDVSAYNKILIDIHKAYFDRKGIKEIIKESIENHKLKRMYRIHE